MLVGDELALLIAIGPGGFPSSSGATHETCVTSALGALGQLVERTSEQTRRQLLERTGLELQRLLDAVIRESDLARAESRLADAESLFQQYLQG